MRVRKTIFTLLLLTALASPTVWATPVYHGVGSDVSVVNTSWNANYIVAPNYRVNEIGFSMTNISANTLLDVKYVLPFTWDGPVVGAYSWVDADNQWHSNAVIGKDGIDGVYIRAVLESGSAPLSRMLMSDTDLPLTDNSKSPMPVASVLSSDRVPVWDVSASLGPSATVNFKIYLEQERDNQITALWISPYAVAIPEPATMCLLGLGALGLLRKRRV